MFKKVYRASALALTALMCMSQQAVFTAFAETVTQESPSGQSSSSGASISQSGPTAEKNYDSKGYLIVNGWSTANIGDSLTGPGATTSTDSSQSASGTAQSSQAPTAATATTATATTATASAITIDSSIAKPDITAGAAALYDATTGQWLYEKNSTTQMAPASTTKLMTALLAVEKLNLTDTITFKSSAVDNLEDGAVTANLKAGDTMTVQDALYAMLLRSACDVANGIAETVSGTQTDFAALMNQRAKELGCTSTNFVNAHGLNSDSHRTTARDMALITKAAFDNQTIVNIASTSSYELPATASRGKMSITNSNRLLKGAADYYEGIIAGKTGYTSKAGSCLASAVMKNGHELIAVVLNDNTNQYKDTKALYDYGGKLLTAAGVTGSSATATSSAAPTATTGTSSTTSSSSGSAGTWENPSGNTWKYKKADGTYCTNEWLDLNGNTYFFGSDSVMCTGWKQFTNGNWYYFNPENGAMVAGKWVTQNGKSYYLQSNGVMAVSTIIDNKYQVDENGVYVKKVG